MDTSTHTIETLFKQLGLASSTTEIDNFINKNKLSEPICLSDADFWTPSQSAFLAEAVADDSDWSEIVDQLDAMLRNPNNREQNII